MTPSSDIIVIAFMSGVPTFVGIAYIEAYLATFIDIGNGFEESTNDGVTVAFEKELKGVREHVRVGAVLFEQLDDIKPTRTCQGLLQSVSRTVSINWCQCKEVEQYIQWKSKVYASVV